MSEISAPNLRWRTSSRSGGAQQCVQIAPTIDGVLVRHSKHPDSGSIFFPATAWTVFLREAITRSYPASSNGVASISQVGDSTLVRSTGSAIELLFDDGEWSAFLFGAENGEFSFSAQLDQHSNVVAQ